jgi:hypothetical protein
LIRDKERGCQPFDTRLFSLDFGPAVAIVRKYTNRLEEARCLDGALADTPPLAVSAELGDRFKKPSIIHVILLTKHPASLEAVFSGKQKSDQVAKGDLDTHFFIELSLPAEPKLSAGIVFKICASRSALHQMQ